jgi:hypothetical protein
MVKSGWTGAGPAGAVFGCRGLVEDVVWMRQWTATRIVIDVKKAHETLTARKANAETKD